MTMQPIRICPVLLNRYEALELAANNSGLPSFIEANDDELRCLGQPKCSGSEEIQRKLGGVTLPHMFDKQSCPIEAVVLRRAAELPEGS